MLSRFDLFLEPYLLCPKEMCECIMQSYHPRCINIEIKDILLMHKYIPEFNVAIN